MPVSQINIDPKTCDGEKKLPLHAFFISLKQNGFLVTPEQIIDANRIIHEFSIRVKNEYGLCKYLSPLFVKNQEEQFQFERIYNTHFNARKDITVKKETTFPGKRAKRFWNIYSAGILATMLFLSLFLLQPSHKQSVNDKPRVYLWVRTDAENFYGDIQISKNKKVEAFIGIVKATADSNSLIEHSVKYDWGDNTSLDTSFIHTYVTEGKFNLKAIVYFYNKNVFQYIDTVTKVVMVCGSDNKLKILNPKNSDSVKIGEKVRLQAIITGKNPDSIRWSANGKVIGYGKEFDTSFNLEGEQYLYCTAIYDSLQSPCSLEQDIDLLVYDPNNLSLLYKKNSFWLNLLGGLSLVLFTLTVFFTRKTVRRKKEV